MKSLSVLFCASAWLLCCGSDASEMGKVGGVGDASSLPTGDAQCRDCVDAGRTTPPPDGGICAPGDVSTYRAGEYRAASGKHQGLCTQDAIRLFYNDCLKPGANPSTCRQSWYAGDALACASCLLTPWSAKTHGPLVEYKATISLNVPGCVELAAPQHLSCAKAMQASLGCAHAACGENCPVTSSATFDAFVACEAEATLEGCRPLTDEADCAGDLREAGAVGQCLGWSSFEEAFFVIAPLFCGAADGG